VEASFGVGEVVAALSNVAEAEETLPGSSPKPMPDGSDTP